MLIYSKTADCFKINGYKSGDTQRAELFIGNNFIGAFASIEQAYVHAIKMRRNLYALLNRIMSQPIIPN